MKLTSTAVVFLVCAMVLTLAKFKSYRHQPPDDIPPDPTVREKMDAEGARKPRSREIAGSRTTKSPAFGTHSVANQTNPELTDIAIPARTENQGQPALQHLTGITSEERQRINDRLVAASSTPDTADDREMMREVHRLATESLSYVADESDGSLETPTPNP